MRAEKCKRSPGTEGETMRAPPRTKRGGVKRTERGWAIAFDDGPGRQPSLYVGWMRTRAAMIAQHVHDTTYADEEQPSQFDLNGRLDELQRERWARCRKCGARAVRVTLTWSDKGPAP